LQDIDQLEYRIATEINATLNGSLTEGGKLGVLPKWVIQPVQAISSLNNPLRLAQLGVLTVANMYTAIDSYRKRKTVDKQIQDAFLLSRLAAITIASESADDEEAVDQIYSQDSYSSLDNLVQVTSRISDLCTEEVNLTGPAHPRFKDLKAAAEKLRARVAEHFEVKTHIQTTVCSGLWENIQDQLYKADEAARRYTRHQNPAAAFDKRQKEDTKKSLYYKSADKKGLIYEPSANDDEFGFDPPGQILEWDMKHCTAQHLKDKAQCESRQPGYGHGGFGSSLMDVSEGNKSDTGLKKELEEKFENASRLAMTYLAGFEDTPCPRVEMTPCQERIIRCIPDGRDILHDLERQWAAEERKAAIKNGHRGFLTKIRRFWGGVKNVAGKLLMLDQIGKVLKLIFRFRDNLKKLLKGKGLEGFAVKQVWRRLVKPVGQAVHKTMTGSGNFIDKFIARKLGEQVKGISFSVAKSMVKGRIAPTPTNLVGWMHGFSWMAVKWAKRIRVVGSCIEAARKLDTDEPVDPKEAEAMAVKEIEEGEAEESQER